MPYAKYKFENYIEPEFPIYSSRQSGRQVLVKIHYHAAAEILEVLEGRVQLLIGTSYRECKKGDVVLFAPSVVHEVVSLTPDAEIQGVVCDFSLLNMDALRLDFAELFRRSQGASYIVSAEEPGNAELRTCIGKITEVYGNFSAVGKLQIISYLLLFMAKIVRIFQLEEGTHDKYYKKLRPVLEYVEKNYTEKLQISQLSELLHVCDDRLIRLFKQVTGETPIEYIMNLRIEAAIKLLSSTEMSVAEIAEQTGFGSDTYMTRVFKQRLGTTPGKYRHK